MNLDKIRQRKSAHNLIELPDPKKNEYTSRCKIVVLVIYFIINAIIIFGGVYACNNETKIKSLITNDFNDADVAMSTLFDVLDTTNDVYQLDIQICALNNAKQILSSQISGQEYVDNKLLMYHMWIVSELAKKQNVYKSVGDN